MKNIRDTDLFLIEREISAGNVKNYYATAKEFSDYIPAFKPGTTCLFYENTAPEGWTQVTNTNVNESIIRLVETGNTGGQINNTMEFKDGFANRVPPVPRHKHNATNTSHNHSVPNVNHGHDVNNPTHNHNISGSAHTHGDYATWRTDTEGGNLKPRGGETGNPSLGNFSTNSAGTGGGGGGSGGSNMTLSINNSGDINHGNSGNSTAGVTKINAKGIGSTMNFNVSYSECILCTKDA